MEKEEIILNRIKKNNGYITSKELEELNVNRFYLSKLEKLGKIERIKRGLYRDVEYIPENELVEVSKIVPKGIVCLESAIEYYNLSTNIPYEYNVAIPSKSKVNIPEYPPIKIIYFSDKNYSLGIVEKEIDGSIIKIYDIEKTVCDVTRYRNKLGKLIFSEVLKEYLKRKDKNIAKLLKYAKITNTFRRLSEYLEVMNCRL